MRQHSPHAIALAVEKRELARGYPRLPLRGDLDLTYRCNNACRHCWLRLPAHAPEQSEELSLAEIRAIADQARALGCGHWGLSGGEPMLRPDFADILDYLTHRGSVYTLNTNGTLITPAIAKLLTRRGTTLISLYGATAAVHDHITRAPGSYEATRRGMRYMQEAGAGFTVWLVPLRDNYHQWAQMLALAESLSPKQGLGASWLFLSASGSPTQNRDIIAQRLDPRQIVELEPPDTSWHSKPGLCAGGSAADCPDATDDRLLCDCIPMRREFHVDPYGQMAHCPFVKDPALRYNLRAGTLQEAWDEFIPALAENVRGGPEYLENCARCEDRPYCRWCTVYGYLEHRRASAPVDYLCQVAGEAHRYAENWTRDHRRHYGIAGITVQVNADIPITDQTFDAKFESFQQDVEAEDSDTVYLDHHFALPNLEGRDLGEKVYEHAPWTVYYKDGSWIYVGSPTLDFAHLPWKVATFNENHTRGHIYHDGEEAFRQGGLGSLSGLPTDQILVARVLADRQGCYFHASGVVLEDQALIFVGHSEAGKSTTVKMLQDQAEILCDDRVIVRRVSQGFHAYGTWSHGEIPIVSSAHAPLAAILMLEQAPENQLIPVTKRQEIVATLASLVVKPLVSRDWWIKTLDLIEAVANEVPVYRMRFDKSGRIVDLLRNL